MFVVLNLFLSTNKTLAYVPLGFSSFFFSFCLYSSTYLLRTLNIFSLFGGKKIFVDVNRIREKIYSQQTNIVRDICTLKQIRWVKPTKTTKKTHDPLTNICSYYCFCWMAVVIIRARASKRPQAICLQYTHNVIVVFRYVTNLIGFYAAVLFQLSPMFLFHLWCSCQPTNQPIYIPNAMVRSAVIIVLFDQ